ncbi:UMP kinase [Halosegnis marinus]|uniref:Uridylate kinase n=1 Tax=Halosegnis marinus TaxID=3034023 RepID=A0ABD5ZPG7_9EURY|nr:UMP kinase [Halosegnis sp. DT85]
MRVVVSVGGSVLVPTPEENRVEPYAAVIEGLAASGHEVAAVVGGGGVAREYIGAARDLGANEIELDQLGIAVTRLNARLLLAALDEPVAASTVAENYEGADEALHRGDIAVMGGVVPAQTTDAVAAALAEYVNADLLVYATSVPGVFTADPNEDPDAERHDELTAEQLVETVATMEMTAGASAPVDLLATKVIQRAGLETIVLDGSDPERVRRAVEAGEFDGTRVVGER